MDSREEFCCKTSNPVGSDGFQRKQMVLDNIKKKLTFRHKDSSIFQCRYVDLRDVSSPLQGKVAFQEGVETALVKTTWVGEQP